ncbi:FtsL-like putative cell division protein [Parapedobacter lycopersici]|uniref:FtsL-like putative cell division protein n=1 Tax=Parapedobacter lycopersici TaxID=1864939 RepID=UPI00214D7A5B|nr:FtsL-like putative cell division protein [Parapedobacter lycopersici]
MVKNAYKKVPLSDEQQEALQDTVEEKADATRNFFQSFLGSDRFSSESFVRYIPFIAFAGLLAILYIANRHYAERTAREIDRLGKEVKEMNWDYKSLSADLMKLTTQTEIAKRVDSMGLKERTQPPKKIIVVKTLAQ